MLDTHRHGVKPIDPAAFWSKVERRSDDQCWPWAGSRRGRNRIGSGHINVGNRRWRSAPQIAWELANGKPFPQGLLACHSCDNPQCVNPAHIWPGTQADNMADALRKGRFAHQRQTHCKRGHEFTPENTLINTRGARVCKACRRILDAARPRRSA